MDIKPENILITTERSWVLTQANEKQDDDKMEGYYEEEIVYKIGDLGHVTSLVNTRELEDEGDCRYLLYTHASPKH